jgi:hypothetical protein
MNERIQKMYEAARVAAGQEHQFETTNLDVAEKFAQLIVKECGRWIVDNAGAMEHLGPEYFCKAMNKHFGVEE